MGQTQQSLSLVALSLALALTGCASIKARQPASESSLPLQLVCAGPANVPWVFGFVPVQNRLFMTFQEDGSARVIGEARVTLRGEDQKITFDGLLPLAGTRTPDGRRYLLQAQDADQRLSIELVHNGTGTIHRQTAVRALPERYEALCRLPAF